jgi:hypothetical protein
VFQLRGFERMRSVAIKAIAYNEIGVSFSSLCTPADGSKLHASLLFFFKNCKKRENSTNFVPLKKGVGKGRGGATRK